MQSVMPLQTDVQDCKHFVRIYDTSLQIEYQQLVMCWAAFALLAVTQ